MTADEKRRRKPRKRGGGDDRETEQGFYAEEYSSREREALEAALAVGLYDEIAMLRVIMRRVLALGEGVEDLEKARRLLATMSAASARLAGMIKTQKELGGDDDQLGRALSETIDALLEELKGDGDAT